MMPMDNSSQGKLSFKGRLSYQDFKDFQLLHSKNKLLFQIIYLFVIYMIVVLVQSSFKTDLLFVFVLFGILVSVAIAVITKGISNYKYKSVFNSDKQLQKEFLYAFDNDGINTDSEVGSGRFKWDEVYQVKQNKKLYSVYIAKNKALIIPKTFFDSAEQITEFEILLRNNLSIKQYRK